MPRGRRPGARAAPACVLLLCCAPPGGVAPAPWFTPRAAATRGGSSPGSSSPAEPGRSDSWPSNSTPLLLTPLLDHGWAELARGESSVRLPGVPTAGHAGYLTVPTKSGKNSNNFFFWYQPCLECGNVSAAPLLQWFQGGPGGPGTFGALAEIGRWYVDGAGSLRERCFTWCRTSSCLFVDQPATVGQSYQTRKDGSVPAPGEIEYTRTTPEAMEAMYQVLSQFLRIWPELQPSPYWITGESYAGNYVAWMGYTVWRHNMGDAPSHNPDAGNVSIHINLRGLMVGDPVLNWVYQMPTYADALYGQGVVTVEEREELRALFDNATDLVRQGNCPVGFAEWNKVWNDDGNAPSPFLYQSMTGSDFTMDVLVGDGGPAGMDNWRGFMESAATKEALHCLGAPQEEEDPADGVYTHMVRSGDWCMNSSQIYATLLVQAGIDVLVYSSTNDPILGPPTTEAGVRALWDYVGTLGAPGPAADFYSQKKTVWRVEPTDQSPAGYTRCLMMQANKSDPVPPPGARFCYAVIRNAGHMAPAFAPRAAWDMQQRFMAREDFGARGPGSAAVPQCAACGGVGPFAGPALPACTSAPEQYYYD